MSESNRLGIKGAIASLIAAGALCTGGLGQGIPACDDPDPNAGDCFKPTPGIPGCTDPECCKIVCDMDPLCCLDGFGWDEQCVNTALANCPGAVCETCGFPNCGDCFVDNGTPFCDDTCLGKECAGCCLIVCGIDPYCCALPPFEDVGNWDLACADEAEEFCSCEPDQVPANDNCEDATAIGEGVFEFTTLCATHDGTDPDVGPCWDGFTGIGADVWFNYTASFTGPVRVHTCGQADFNAKLAVYAGCVCPLTEEMLIECNDNGCGDGSEVIFNAVAGNCYTIRLGGGYLDPSGSGTVTVEPIGPPSNDNCTDAIVIGLGTTLTFNSLEATTDGSPSPVCDFGAGGDIENDVWYDFTPAEDGTYLASTCGSAFNTKVAVYLGCGCPPAADPIVCNDDACGVQSLVTFDAIGGQCYKIRVGGSPLPGAGGSSGSGQLFVATAPSGFDFFFDQASFETAVKAAGKVLKGTEDFSENTLGPNGIDGMDDPLDANSSDPESFPDGILIDNLTFQANTGGADSTVPAPHTPNNPGEEGLVLVTAPSNGVTADAVLANFFVDSYDVLSGPPAGDSHTALGITMVSITGSETVTVTVYDQNNVLLGAMTNLPAVIDGGTFFGILATGGNTIGRVNVYDSGGGAEGVYDVTAYVGGGACPWDLDGGGDVGVGDLLILLANWANPYGVPDLLQMLAAWGPCP